MWNVNFLFFLISPVQTRLLAFLQRHSLASTRRQCQVKKIKAYEHWKERRSFNCAHSFTHSLTHSFIPFYSFIHSYSLTRYSSDFSSHRSAWAPVCRICSRTRAISRSHSDVQSLVVVANFQGLSVSMFVCVCVFVRVCITQSSSPLNLCTSGFYAQGAANNKFD